MVYKYIRKSDRGSWSEENMAAAIKEAKKSSISAASKQYNIPFATLYRHLKTGSSTKKLGRFETVFTIVEEQLLSDYLKTMDSIFYGLTRSEFMKLAGDFAKHNNKAHPFKNACAGKSWLNNFHRRNPDIVLRSPEPTSIARARGFNRPQVERFYQILGEQIEKHKFDASRIYNMDETGIRNTTNKPPKVLSVYGKKQIGAISSLERGQLSTVICCCNAAGSFIHPFFIFARKIFLPRLLDGAPPGSQGACTDKGWVTGEKFLDWLKFFVDHVRPSAEKKVLLLLDNHESHKYYPALEYASLNNVIFVSFAPHTTHKIQPLDKSVYGPIKKYFEQEVNLFQKSHPGRIINQLDMARLFCPAYLKGASPHNAISGFSSPGIWPFNPNVFGDEEFAAASVTDRLINENAQVSSSAPETSASSSALPESALVNSIQSSSPSTASNLKETGSDMVLPSDIRPLPKIAEQKMTVRKRKPQRAEILTSTPIKKDQQQKNEKNQIKNKDKRLVKRNLTGNSSTTSAAGKTFHCTVCKELYTKPPTEDWIPCSQCQEWSHEDCTSYTGWGSYFCIECED